MALSLIHFRAVAVAMPLKANLKLNIHHSLSIFFGLNVSLSNMKIGETVFFKIAFDFKSNFKP